MTGKIELGDAYALPGEFESAPTDSQLIELMARRFCTDKGNDPDRMVQESGYSHAKRVPLWKSEVYWAERVLAGYRLLRSYEK